jgi:hypothetical protein
MLYYVREPIKKTCLPSTEQVIYINLTTWGKQTTESAMLEVTGRPLRVLKNWWKRCRRKNNISGYKSQMNSFVTHGGFHIIQYKAVCQQQETKYKAQQAFGILKIHCLSGGSGWWLVLDIHQYSVPRLKKAYTNTSIPNVAILACSSVFP